MAESTDAHNKLQSNLSKTMQEIYDQEKHIAQLKKSIRDKEAPLKVLFRILIAPVYLVYRNYEIYQFFEKQTIMRLIFTNHG